MSGTVSGPLKGTMHCHGAISEVRARRAQRPHGSFCGLVVQRRKAARHARSARWVRSRHERWTSEARRLHTVSSGGANRWIEHHALGRACSTRAQLTKDSPWLSRSVVDEGQMLTQDARQAIQGGKLGPPNAWKAAKRQDPADYVVARPIDGVASIVPRRFALPRLLRPFTALVSKVRSAWGRRTE